MYAFQHSLHLSKMIAWYPMDLVTVIYLNIAEAELHTLVFYVYCCLSHIYILQSCVRLNEKGAQSLQTGLTTGVMGLYNCFWMVRPHQSSAAPESAPQDIQGRLPRPTVNCKDVIGSTVNEARMNGIRYSLPWCVVTATGEGVVQASLNRYRKQEGRQA